LKHFELTALFEHRYVNKYKLLSILGHMVVTGQLENEPQLIIIADFRGRLTCLIPTQFRSLTMPFFLVFSGFEHDDVGVV
jgi:hypothetical protein